MNLFEISQKVISAVAEIEAFIMTEFKNFERHKIELKGVNSLVSYVDRQAEQFLVDELRKILPQAGFIAEEGTGQKSENGYNWLVDPLDGTTNFVHGLPFIATSVALMHKNEILLGVINDMVHNSMFYAVQNGGAYLNNQKINVSETTSLADSLVATGFPYEDFDRMSEYMNMLRDMMRRSHGLRRIGSAALDLCYVACGRFDAFFEYNLKPWDVAAGVLIVREAGGIATDFQKGDNCIFGRELLAANPKVYPEVLEMVKKNFY
ncbi:MAG: inositol monophosphatase [Cytophagales bacterium]|nr:inositol monophosphatase [Cytophagales bacterium]MDW8384028.1 inositol monophosphatase family protein [Flammeovirgaceae bacterium]